MCDYVSILTHIKRNVTFFERISLFRKEIKNKKSNIYPTITASHSNKLSSIGLALTPGGGSFSILYTQEDIVIIIWVGNHNMWKINT